MQTLQRSVVGRQAAFFHPPRAVRGRTATSRRLVGVRAEAAPAASAEASASVPALFAELGEVLEDYRRVDNSLVSV